MKLKTFFVVFEGLSFGEKIKIWWKIADTSFKMIYAALTTTGKVIDNVSLETPKEFLVCLKEPWFFR